MTIEYVGQAENKFRGGGVRLASSGSTLTRGAKISDHD